MSKTTATRGSKDRARIRRAVIKRDGLQCHWCLCRLTTEREQPNSLTLDHVVPHSKGGKLRIDNIVLACMPCNQARGNRGYQEHYLRQQFAPLLKEAGLA